MLFSFLTAFLEEKAGPEGLRLRTRFSPGVRVDMIAGKSR